MEDQDVTFFLFASSLALIFIVTGFVFFMSLFLRAKRRTYLEKQEAELNFQKELNKANNEIQVQTLDNVGRELHDNIGQLLAVTKIHANNIVEDAPSEVSTELNKLLDQVILEVRYLSRSLNSVRFAQNGFYKTLKQEANRINKLRGINCHLELRSEPSFEIDENRGIMVFRILQEFISNTLKHSRADQINFAITYSSDEMSIEGSDNGIGFDLSNQTFNGAGILNMKNRADLIGATFEMKSALDVGTTVKITIPKTNNHDV